MKLNNKIGIWILLSGMSMVYSGCHKHQGVSDEEVQLGKLSGVWKINSATLDGVIQDGFSGFSLTLSGTSGSSQFQYATLGRPLSSPWPAAGTWTFGSSISTMLIRDQATADELPMSYLITGQQLELDFQYSGKGYLNSREKAVTGNWQFKFTHP